ncbi:MAG: ABC transporter permease [Clostridium sp.]|nr:ABC transporter permease [Clostridium sp.]
MNLFKTMLSRHRIWLLCILTFAVMPFVKPAFLSANNMQGIMTGMVPYGIVALGLAMTLITGEINISIGAVMAFSGVIFTTLLPRFTFLPAMAAALLACALVGMVDGFFVAYKKLPAFLVSVAVMTGVRGLALAVCGSKPVQVTNPLIAQLNLMKAGPVPVLFVLLLALVFLLEFFLKRTQTGRNMYAVGGAGDVASAYGLNVEKYKFWALTFSSFMAGLGGIALVARMNSGSPSVGEDAMPSVLPMIVIGGTSISGGKGGMVRTLSGILLINLIFNIMSMFNIYVNIQNLIKGSILLIIVVADKYLENKDRKI